MFLNVIHVLSLKLVTVLEKYDSFEATDLEIIIKR